MFSDAQYNGQSVAFAEDDFVAVALEACLSDPELDAALAEFDLVSLLGTHFNELQVT